MDTQSLSLLINYLDITIRLHNKLVRLQKLGPDNVRIGDVCNRLMEREQSELLIAISKFTGKRDGDKNDMWGIDNLNYLRVN